MTLTERNLVLDELRKWQDSRSWMKNVPALRSDYLDSWLQIDRAIAIMECVEIHGLRRSMTIK